MVVALIALMVALSGTSFAIGRDTAPTIKACQDKQTGVLAVKRSCAPGDKRVSWSITGPAGPAGATGPTGTAGAKGDAGATGATGPSNAYSATSSFGMNIASNTAIVSLTLPAGRYVVSGKVSVAPNTNTGAGGMQECRLWAVDDWLDVAYTTSALNKRETCALLATVEFASSTTVDLKLIGGMLETVNYEKAVLTAIKVGSIN